MRNMMRLHELCEPLFQYICRLNRSARKGVGLEPSLVRTDVQALFGDLRSRASSDAGLADQFAKVELALIYFVDFMIRESALPFSSQWKDLAHEQGKLEGDEDFFDLLDDTLRDSSEAASERLTVFYTCLGLGFTGFYAGQPEYLRKKMMEIQARIRPVMDLDTQSRICPEAYEHVDTRPLNLPPLRNLGGMVAALVAVVIGVFVANWVLYTRASAELSASLTHFQELGQKFESDRSAPEGAAADEGS